MQTFSRCINFCKISLALPSLSIGSQIVDYSFLLPVTQELCIVKLGRIIPT